LPFKASDAGIVVMDEKEVSKFAASAGPRVLLIAMYGERTYVNSCCIPFKNRIVVVGFLFVGAGLGLLPPQG
jgi:hypothetical protein